MDTVQQLMEISSRLEHLEDSAEWISKEMVHRDQGVSQTSTLITVLAEEIREKIYILIKTMEHEQINGKLH